MEKTFASAVVAILTMAMLGLAAGCVAPRGPKLPGPKRLPTPPRVHAPHGLPPPVLPAPPKLP